MPAASAASAMSDVHARSSTTVSHLVLIAAKLTTASLWSCVLPPQLLGAARVPPPSRERPPRPEARGSGARGSAHASPALRGAQVEDGYATEAQ
jgi:hypothetical protein